MGGIARVTDRPPLEGATKTLNLFLNSGSNVSLLVQRNCLIPMFSVSICFGVPPRAGSPLPGCSLVPRGCAATPCSNFFCLIPTPAEKPYHPLGNVHPARRHTLQSSDIHTGIHLHVHVFNNCQGQAKKFCYLFGGGRRAGLEML